MKDETMENIIIIPEDKNQANFLKELFKRMKIQFKTEPSDDLEEKLKQAREDKKNGNLIEVDPKNLWKSIGLD